MLLQQAINTLSLPWLITATESSHAPLECSMEGLYFSLFLHGLLPNQIDFGLLAYLFRNIDIKKGTLTDFLTLRHQMFSTCCLMSHWALMAASSMKHHENRSVISISHISFGNFDVIAYYYSARKAHQWQCGSCLIICKNVLFIVHWAFLKGNIE